MDSILISIKPYYVFLIIAKTMGWNIHENKTEEMRKIVPLNSRWNRKGAIYCSKDTTSFNKIPEEYQELMKPLLGKVVASFSSSTTNLYECEFYEGNSCYQSIKKLVYDETAQEYAYHFQTSNDCDLPNDCEVCRDTCLTLDEIKRYVNKTGFSTVYTLTIDNLKIYDKPKALSEFKHWESFGKGKTTISIVPITRPPQSWCYVESTCIY